MNEKYWYKMVYRPFDIGAQPKGQIDYEEKDRRADGCFCAIAYDHKLTTEEIERFELEETE